MGATRFVLTKKVKKNSTTKGVNVKVIALKAIRCYHRLPLIVPMNNFEALFDEEIKAASVPSNWKSAVNPGKTDADEIARAIEVVQSLTEALVGQRETVRQWLGVEDVRSKGQAIPTEKGPWPEFSHKNYYHGEIANEERSGFGLTTNELTDWNISGGHTYICGLEMGWNEPGKPLQRGLFYREGESRYDKNRSGIRSIDPETGKQIGLWHSRVGGQRIDQLKKGPREVNEWSKYIGSFTPLDKESMASIVLMVSSHGDEFTTIKKRVISRWDGNEHMFFPKEGELFLGRRR